MQSRRPSGSGELERAAELTSRLERRAARLESAIGLAGSTRARGAPRLGARGLRDGGARVRPVVGPRRRERACVRGRTIRSRRRGVAASREALGRGPHDARAVPPPPSTVSARRVWRDRAQGELARVPGRRPRGSTLTQTETRIAELVAHGHTNKEVAAAVFVTPKTVEAHLSRIYAKLGVRSRTELARNWAQPKL